SPGTGVVWAIFPGKGIGTPNPNAPETLSLHAYDASNLQTNLLAGPNGQVGLDAGTWQSAVASSGNSFETPTVIHGKVFTGSEDRLRVYAPVKHCRQIIVGKYILWICDPLKMLGGRMKVEKWNGREWMAVNLHAFPLHDGS